MTGQHFRHYRNASNKDDYWTSVYRQKKKKQIETNDWRVAPNEGHAVAIIASFEDEATIQSLKNIKIQDNEASGKSLPILKLAKKKTMPSRSEAPVTVRTTEEDTFIVGSLLP